VSDEFDLADEASDHSPSPRVVITNGFKNFHLAGAAFEADARGYLELFVCGLYPTTRVKSVIRSLGIGRLPRIRRLLERSVSLNDSRICQLAGADLTSEAGSAVGRLSEPLAEAIEREAMRLFSAGAGGALRGKGRRANIYHFRAGYGLGSIKVAKSLGMVTLCDHSIAHPRTLRSLVENGGKLPSAEQLEPTEGFWRFVEHDIEEADHVVVNSEFVRDTFVAAGANNDVSVIYLGVDDAFIKGVPQRRPRPPSGGIRLLFAGTFSARKGADVLARSIAALPGDGWSLDIAGPIEKAQAELFQSLVARPGVRYRGVLARSELAQLMSETDVFIFPSLAEGSARVVFEALACGCYVVTTPNAGSIVRDGVHGKIIPPQDSAALARVLEELIKDSSQIDRIGRQNAAEIQSNFSQSHYGDEFVRLYRQLLARRNDHGPGASVARAATRVGNQ
jgi:glycosyltransferase involved in cell wall biosynthesis